MARSTTPHRQKRCFHPTSSSSIQEGSWKNFLDSAWLREPSMPQKIAHQISDMAEPSLQVARRAELVTRAAPLAFHTTRVLQIPPSPNPGPEPLTALPGDSAWRRVVRMSKLWSSPFEKGKRAGEPSERPEWGGGAVGSGEWGELPGGYKKEGSSCRQGSKDTLPSLSSSIIANSFPGSSINRIYGPLGGGMKEYVP